jgi:hypothetical protein
VIAIRWTTAGQTRKPNTAQGILARALSAHAVIAVQNAGIADGSNSAGHEKRWPAPRLNLLQQKTPLQQQTREG